MGNIKKKIKKLWSSKGVKVVEKIMNEAILKKIKYLTLYTFSTENWKRPKKEIKFFNLFIRKIY